MKSSGDDASPHVEQSGQGQMSSANNDHKTLLFLNNLKEVFRDRKDKYNDFVYAMRDYKSQSISTIGMIARVMELFKGNQELILGFNEFLPRGYEIILPLPLEDEPKKPIEFDVALSYVNKIKTRFKDDYHVYNAFINVLNMYKKNNMSNKEVYQELSVLFQDHADLLVELTHFLPDTRSTHVEKKPTVFDGLINHRDSRQFEKDKEKGEDGQKNEWELDDNLVNRRKKIRQDDCAINQSYRGCLQNNKQVYKSLKVDSDEDRHEGENRERKRDHDKRDRRIKRIPSYASQKEFLSKPIRELDVSNCVSCTPSYRLLPEDYPIPSTKSRKESDAKVLNDHWVSISLGGENSFKHMQKNQYEISLSRCDDDRFELDMLLESVNAAAKRVEEILDSMNARTTKLESSFCVEDHLSACHLRCIESLYGDLGLDLIDALRTNVHVVLPVILVRLKQKQEEWTRSRARFNELWAEIYSKNYHKSLDYRSIYFKQQDIKNLNSKALLAEIKETSEKNQNEDEMVLSIASGYTRPTKPHMEFEYPSLDIQEDLRQLIEYSCGEVCKPDQCKKVMKVWTTFLEPFLGVRSCPPNGDEIPPEDSFFVKCQKVGSAQVSLDRENASEIVDDSGSESANGEECSPKEADDDADNDMKAETEEAMCSSGYLLQTVNPLRTKVPSALKCKEKNSRIFYGNDAFYLLIRLHQMLYERIQIAKLQSSSSKTKWSVSNDANAVDSYSIFKDALHSLLSGSSDNAKFEEECLALIGPQSYILFTLDKLILKLVKQLRFIATEEIENKLLNLYYENSRSPETFSTAVYYENARFLLPGDNLYRMEFLPRSMCLTVHLMKYDLNKLCATVFSMDQYVAFHLNDELLAVPRRSPVSTKKEAEGCVWP